MSDPINILLVEGESDQGFFIEVLKELNLPVTVKVAPPKEQGGTHNGKEGVFNLLPNLLANAADGSYRLAAVVDADSAPNGGFSTTRDRVSKIVGTSPFQYQLADNPITGLIYKHDELPDFGLWVMPDNFNEGILEDWLKHCIDDEEQPLFAHAKTTVRDLDNPKFKSLYHSKAEVATWLAWQKKPGHGLYKAVEDKLLNESKPLYQQLTAWLELIFKPEVR